MKIGITPLVNGKVKYIDDIKYHHDLGMIYEHDIYDKKTNRWYRLYSSVLLMPFYAKEIFRLAEDSYSVGEERNFECQASGGIKQLTIAYKQDLEECYHLKLNNGTSVYYY